MGSREQPLEGGAAQNASGSHRRNAEQQGSWVPPPLWNGI